MAYDWKKGTKKFFWVFLGVLVAGWISYATAEPRLLVLVPVLEVFRNWLKHR
ncbi:MAG: hypothetical protein HY427_03665 [Candidatus Levybacteria bacterium]|nr:hypothetical protein [Candidatus Levybacteria bacterium]